MNFPTKFSFRAALAALALIMIASPAQAQAPAGGPGGAAPQQGPGGPGGGPGGPGGPGGRAGGGGGGAGGGGRGGMAAYDHNDHAGYVQIFDGKSMDGWDFPPEIFRLEGDEIVAGYDPKIPPGTTFAVYTKAEPADFDLLVDIKSDGGNTGIHFRSVRNDSEANGNPNWMNQPQLNALVAIDVAMTESTAAVTAARTAVAAAALASPADPAVIQTRIDALAAAELNSATLRAGQWAALQASANKLSAAQIEIVRNQFGSTGTLVASTPGRGAFTHWYVGGYQADYPAVGNIWEGGLRGRTPAERGNITTNGNITVAMPDRSVKVIGTLPTGDANGPFLKQGDWNQYHVMCRGNTMVLFLNGHMISMVIDDNAASFRPKGVIGLQIEGPGKQHFKNIWLKEVKTEATAPSAR
jgi:hypothetical protein